MHHHECCVDYEELASVYFVKFGVTVSLQHESVGPSHAIIACISLYNLFEWTGVFCCGFSESSAFVQNRCGQC